MKFSQFAAVLMLVAFIVGGGVAVHFDGGRYWGPCAWFLVVGWTLGRMYQLWRERGWP